MSADGVIRWSASAVTTAVAGAAGWVSYLHALSVVRMAGETGAVSFVYPVFIDGVVYCSSMVLLSAARRRQDAPVLAWWALGVGIALTLCANVASMAAHGPLGMFVGSLPAVALILSYELLMIIIRGQVRAQVRVPAPAPAPAPAPVPAPAPALLPTQHRSETYAFKHYLERGEVPGLRTIKSELGVGQRKAQAIQAQLRRELVPG
jgi:Protein of unknown function (DUF2637)